MSTVGQPQSESSRPLALERVPGRYAVCRMPPSESIPAWALNGGGLVSITRSDQELSIVADESRVPPQAKAERGFVAMRIAGTLDFNLIGVIAKLTGALAAASVPVFVISTFQTDYLLVKEADADRAIEALGRLSRIVL